jgi:hypothetical protein
VLLSYVLRVIPEELRSGRLVGDVEAVRTGEHQAIRDVEELVTFCVKTGSDEAGSSDVTN